MLAMYPPNGSYTETLELHTMDETYDDTTANSKYVSAFQATNIDLLLLAITKNMDTTARNNVFLLLPFVFLSV